MADPLRMHAPQNLRAVGERSFAVFAERGPRQNAGVQTEAQCRRIAVRQRLRLSLRLQKLRRRNEPQLQRGNVRFSSASQKMQQCLFHHRLVSVRRAASTVTFSITFPPTSALSCIWLHWQPE